MERIPEPELMDDDEQARAYAEADFEAPHSMFIALFRRHFSDVAVAGTVLDLGCGPADISLRFAAAYPACRVHGVDGARAMLNYGIRAVRQRGMAQRVRLIHGCLPGADLPEPAYDAVISNSLLHHLGDPQVLWRDIAARAKPGAPVFIMDLMRPDSRAQAQTLVDTYAADEPPILRTDFFNSLLAAYRPDEVADQLRATGIDYLHVEAVSDRHLIARGRASGAVGVA